MADYTDKGCEVASSCLDCPLDECIYDTVDRKHSPKKIRRDMEIRKLYSAGTTKGDLLRMFHLGSRTLTRILGGK